MSITRHHMLGALVIGVGASLFMDAWNLFLKRAAAFVALQLEYERP